LRFAVQPKIKGDELNMNMMKSATMIILAAGLVLGSTAISTTSPTVQAAEVVNATNFGVRAGVTSSQTQALHSAMKYFYDKGQVGTVYLPAGTYYVDESIRFHAGVSLNGDGMGKTIIKKMGSRAEYVVGAPVLKSNSISLNMTVSNLTIDADRRNRESKGLAQVGGINIDTAVSNLTLSKVQIRDTTIGALLRRTRDSVITDSQFDMTSGHAIAAGHESYPVGEFRNVKITNNKITNSTGGSGINLSRAAHTTVTGNQIINSTQQNDTYAGIRIPNGGEYNTVSNNTIKNYPRGIFLTTGARYNTISNNTVTDSRLQGVLIESDNNTLSYNTIQQFNTSLSPESVIRLSNASSNKIERNTIQTHASFTNVGIRVTGTSNNNQILNNIVDTKGKTSISVEGGSGNVVSGNSNPNK
jgi:3-dehydroshikimate dehydratase